ncbi:MAG: LysM domain-containing protein [Gammaproteobacteria bacterium]
MAKHLTIPKRALSLLILTLFVAGCATAPEPSPPPEPPKVAEPAPAPKPAPVKKVEVKPTAPKTYVVVKGDTLWDISKKFLRDPWYWPEIWQENQQIKNPHLIYPGDVLTLYYVKGVPHIKVTGGPRVSGTAAPAPSPEYPTVKLNPEVRSEPLESRESQIPVGAMRQFFIRPRVVSEETLKNAPYIFASADGHLIYGSGNIVYVRGLSSNIKANRFSVFRPGQALRDPKTGELLGYEAIHVGDASLVKRGNPATVVLTTTNREVLKGDRLLPIEPPQSYNFMPHEPDQKEDGQIISLFDAISMVGRNQIVVLNLGRRNDVNRGAVFAVYQGGRTVRDPLATTAATREVKLPEEKVGVVMVFKVFNKISYALVMESTKPIVEGDAVTNP